MHGALAERFEHRGQRGDALRGQLPAELPRAGEGRGQPDAAVIEAAIIGVGPGGLLADLLGQPGRNCRRILRFAYSKPWEPITSHAEGGYAVLPVHNFSYGLLTPGLGYIMSCLGAFIGLRCTSRARAYRGAARARWLLLGGTSIGSTGIWVMHFIAMLGFTIPGESIGYNVPVTIVSLLVAVTMVCAGLLIAGFGRGPHRSLLLGGLITGLGVACMHYLGMAAMRMPGKMTYDPLLFILSAVIAIVAATAALWAALRLRGVLTTLAASLIMGIAVSGMHYTGMAAMHMYRASGPAGMVMGGGGSATAESFLLPLIIGISMVSFLLSATVATSPTEEEIHYDAALLSYERITSAASRNGTPATRPRSIDLRKPSEPL